MAAATSRGRVPSGTSRWEPSGSFNFNMTNTPTVRTISTPLQRACRRTDTPWNDGVLSPEEVILQPGEDCDEARKYCGGKAPALPIEPAGDLLPRGGAGASLLRVQGQSWSFVPTIDVRVPARWCSRAGRRAFRGSCGSV